MYFYFCLFFLPLNKVFLSTSKQTSIVSDKGHNLNESEWGETSQNMLVAVSASAFDECLWYESHNSQAITEIEGWH